MRKLIYVQFVLLCALLCSCGEEKKNTSQNTVSTTLNCGGPGVLPVNESVIFSLSLLSNLPAATTAGYCSIADLPATAAKKIEGYAHPKILACLNYGGTSPVLSNWQLVWGPAVRVAVGDPLTKATFGTYVSANSMCIFKDNDSNYVVAIQATNPYCPYAWDTLDFNVKTTRPWIRGSVTEGYISEGTSIGLGNLLALTDSATGQTAAQYLLQNANSASFNVTVTGHSLGGALSPVYALCLKDSLNLGANIYCMATAGATPGDTAFAQYYSGLLGAHTARIWNYYDVVPRAWVDSLLTDVGNYAPSGIYSAAGGSVAFQPPYNPCKNVATPGPFNPIPTPDYIDAIISGATSEAQASGKLYAHLCPGTIFQGAPGGPYINVNPDTSFNHILNFLLHAMGKNIVAHDTTFLPQLGNQHVGAYTMYFQILPMQQYMRGLINGDPTSVVNKCGWGCYIPTQTPQPAGKPYSQLMGIIQKYAWQ